MGDHHNENYKIIQAGFYYLLQAANDAPHRAIFRDEEFQISLIQSKYIQ